MLFKNTRIIFFLITKIKTIIVCNTNVYDVLTGTQI